MKCLVRSLKDSPIFQYIIRRICVHLHTEMGRGQHFVGSRNLQICSASARKIRSGFAWFRLPRNSATKKQSDALFHGQIIEHLCSLQSRWESRTPCQCCLAKRSGLVFGVRNAAIKKNQNYVSDTKIDASSLLQERHLNSHSSAL